MKKTTFHSSSTFLSTAAKVPSGSAVCSRRRDALPRREGGRRARQRLWKERRRVSSLLIRPRRSGRDLQTDGASGRNPLLEPESPGSKLLRRGLRPPSAGSLSSILCSTSRSSVLWGFFFPPLRRHNYPAGRANGYRCSRGPRARKQSSKIHDTGSIGRRGGSGQAWEGQRRTVSKDHKVGANTGAKRPPNTRLHILLHSEPNQGETEGRMHRRTKVKSQRGQEEREGKEDERQA